jgi:hypothetical protein
VFARYIVGWRVSSSMQTDFVLDALEQALYARQPWRHGGLTHHSDRGSQCEFNPSSQHILTGGVDELEELEVGSIAPREAALAWASARVVSLRATAILEGDFRGLLQRGRSWYRGRVPSRRQSMVPTMRRYAPIESLTVRARTDGPLPILR